MRLPSVDFELMYWRLRRRMQRLRGAFRAYRARRSAEAYLDYLYRFGRLPGRPEPEETFAYRAMWVIVVGALALILTIEAVGEDKFRAGVTAALAAPQEAHKDVDLSADTEALQHLKQPNT